MRISSQLLLTFLLNAVWQIALIGALASLGAWLLRRSAMRYQHWLWVGALCLSVLVPLVAAVTALHSLSDASTTVVETPTYQPEFAAPFASATIPRPLDRTPANFWNSAFQLNRNTVLVLFAAYFLFLVYRVFKLTQAWYTTRKIRNSATEIDPDEDLMEIIRQCEMRLNLEPDRVTLCRSESLPLPVTVGLFRPAIILPVMLLHKGDRDLLTSAIGHEFIHVARHDYVLNFFYELLFLPISFHPAAWLSRSRIKQTRELCCDELVAERILSAQVYARSLVALASSAPPLRRLSVTTTVGIADADILEARIMSLLSKPKLIRRWKTVPLVAVSLLLLIPSFAAAAFAMRFELATTAQELTQQEKELVEKRKAAADEVKERVARDPRFREEVQRKREVEMEMRAIRQGALVRLSRLTMDQAIQIATSQNPGKVMECHLDADKWEEPGKLAKDGVVFYRVVIADETIPGGATHVWVNAVDGTVIKSEKELPRKRSPQN
jgi:beta-lactamase regulating signal transducer with metallopeptidase domain